jgi:hypothetical protein
MKRLVLFSTIFGLLSVAGPAIANSEEEETHIGEGSFQNIGQNSGQGNLDGNFGLPAPALPALPALPAPPSGLPALPAPPSGLPALPAPPSGLPALPTLPTLPTLPGLPSGLLPPLPVSGLPTPVSGLPTGLPDLSTLPIHIPLTLQAPLGLPTL